MPVGSYDLPENPEPADFYCLLLKIPKDPAYLKAVYSALYDLTLWNSWVSDSAHTAIRAAQQMKKMWLTDPVDCDTVLPGVPGSSGVDTDLMIRQNPTNPCILESSLDGVTWCQWADLSKCMGVNTIVPPKKNPPDGTCARYPLALQGGMPILLPDSVSTGDTLTITQSSGAVNDGDLTHPWFCTTGQQYFLGECSGPIQFDATDLVPGAGKGTILAKIGSNFYALSASPFTVPSGVANAQVTILPNFPTTIKGFGVDTLEIELCKVVPPTAPWCVEWDFTVNAGSWAGVQLHDGNGTAVPLPYWSPGVGWLCDADLNPPATTYECLMLLQIPITSGGTIETVEVNGHLALLTQTTEAHGVLMSTVAGSGGPFTTLLNFNPMTAGADFDKSATGLTNTLESFLSIIFFDYSMPGGAAPDLTIRSVKITGTGAAPATSNC